MAHIEPGSNQTPTFERKSTFGNHWQFLRDYRSLSALALSCRDCTGLRAPTCTGCTGTDKLYYASTPLVGSGDVSPLLWQARNTNLKWRSSLARQKGDHVECSPVSLPWPLLHGQTFAHPPAPTPRLPAPNTQSAVPNCLCVDGRTRPTCQHEENKGEIYPYSSVRICICISLHD